MDISEINQRLIDLHRFYNNEVDFQIVITRSGLEIQLSHGVYNRRALLTIDELTAGAFDFAMSQTLMNLFSDIKTITDYIPQDRIDYVNEILANVLIVKTVDENTALTITNEKTGAVSYITTELLALKSQESNFDARDYFSNQVDKIRGDFNV